MSDSHSDSHPDRSVRVRREHGAPSGWDRYLDLLVRERIAEHMRPWYVVRAKEFLHGMRPKRLSDLTADDVATFFREVSESQRLNAWQFRQLVEAVQLLVIDLGQVTALRVFDWDWWKAAGEDLPADHPTLAKEQTPEELVQRRVDPRFTRAAEAYRELKDMARILRTRHYSIRTEKTYVEWCHRFLLSCSAESAEGLGPEDVQRFLSHLAIERNCSSSTQNQALNALLFLFKEVLGRPLDDLAFRRAKRPARLPVVLTKREVAALLGELGGVHGQCRQLSRNPLTMLES